MTIYHTDSIDHRDVDRICHQLKVTERTARRWIKEGIPHIPGLLLSLSLGRYPGWDDVRIGQGELWLPDGTRRSREQVIMGAYWERHAITETQRCCALEDRLRMSQRITQAANEPSSFDKLAILDAGWVTKP